MTRLIPLLVVFALALQTQQRQRGTPGGLARFSERRSDSSVAVGVALDEPFEAEVDERGRLDDELVIGRRLAHVTGATLTTRTIADAVRRVLAVHAIVAGRALAGKEKP